MTTFDEIADIGAKIRDIYLNDPDQVDWFNSISDMCSEDQPIPDDTFNQVVDYLESRKTEECSKLADIISYFAREDETPDNVIYAIFTIIDDEIPETSPDIPDIPSGGFEEEEDESLNNPQAYFDTKIQKIQSTLSISYDLAYLLLKVYKWDYNGLVNSWIDSQSDTLKKLNIHFGSSQFPSQKSPLLSNVSQKGSCALCADDADLLQLYCGHELCQDCLIDEITVQINEGKLPECRFTNDKLHCMCKSEIIPSDVYNLIEDETILEKYNKLRLQSEIDSCPGCKILLTNENDLGCHTGQCPRCHFVTCLKCMYPGSHAPLFNCDHVNDFTIVIKNKMAMLDQAQKLWYIREERLKDYRKHNQREFLNYFDSLIAKSKNEFKTIDKKETDNIKKVEKENSIKETNLSNLLKKSRDSGNKKGQFNDEIYQIQKELDNGRRLKSLYERDHNINHKDRDKYIHRFEKMKQFFIWSVTEERHKFQYGITKFKTKLNRLVSQKLSKPIDENADNAADSSSKVTKLCPRCHVAIYKQGGCNYVQCLKCRYEFCWICNQAWVAPHGDHFFCPNYSLSDGVSKNHTIYGINYDDPSDKKFYPMPLDPEKMTEFVKYNNLYMEYKKNLEKFEKLSEDFLKESDKADVRIKLLDCLNKENSKETSIELANNILNDILFAQSVLAWGQAELFYIIGNEVTYKLFEFRLFELDQKICALLKILDYPDVLNPTTFFTREMSVVKNMVQNILISAETQR